MIVKGAEVILLKNEHKITRRRQAVSPLQMICQQKRFEADKLIDDNVVNGGIAYRQRQFRALSLAEKGVWKLLEVFSMKVRNGRLHFTAIEAYSPILYFQGV